MKKKLCILVPTKGNPDNIEWMISESKDILVNYDIDLYIGESDEKQESKEIIKEYQNKGYKNIFYYFFENDLEPEIKVQRMCGLEAENYEYLWVCKDRNFPNLQKIGNTIMRLLDENYSIVSLLNCDRTHRMREFTSRPYNDRTLFFRELFWSLTSWDSSIINSKIGVFFRDATSNRYGSDNSFFMLESIFRYIASDSEFSSYNLVGDLFIHANKRISSWKYKDKLLYIWGRAWCDTINRLPSVYDKEKDNVKRSFDRYRFNYYSIKHLLSFRADMDFSIDSIKNNKEYIPQITKTNIVWFYIIALIPQKPLALLKKIVKRFIGEKID